MEVDEDSVSCSFFYHANNHRLTEEKALKCLLVSVKFEYRIRCGIILSWFLGTLYKKNSSFYRAVVFLP
jgi:hypothetical protein